MNKLTERLVLGGGALVLGLVIGWGVRGVTTYKSDTESMANFQDWRTACPPANMKVQSCQMIEEVLDNRTQSAVLRVSIGTDPKDKKQKMQIVLPLGVALQAGSGLALDKEPVRPVAYRACSAVGCIGTLEMDDKLIADLKKAKEGKVFFAGLDGKPVAVPLSLKGYAEASRAYRSAQARRTSWFWRLFS